MTVFIILLFIVGYTLIVLEELHSLDKTVPALFMAVGLWTIIALNDKNGVWESSLTLHFSHICEVLIFLLGAMTVVELIDLHKGFEIITHRLGTRKPVYLLWQVAIVSFLLSGVLDNLTTAFVMVSVLRKLLPNGDTRKYLAGFVIIAANAGGAWSPIGDVTTTMLWTAGKVSAGGLVWHVFLPSLACLTVPCLLATRTMRRATVTALPRNADEDTVEEQIYGSKTMFFTGITALLFVPVWHLYTGLPPYMGMLGGLAGCWLVGEGINTKREHDDRDHYSVHYAMSRIEISTLLFFLGILLSVAALEEVGLLRRLADISKTYLQSDWLVATVIGFCSAVIDNVPLVAAAIGAYTPPPDDLLWQIIAYCAGTGGSIFIIGSAAGIAVMSAEKISFGWYLRQMSGLALAGYLSGVLVFWLLH